MIKSPCTRHCGLVDGLCHGCGRTVREIRLWSKLSEQEKEEVSRASSDRLGSLQALRNQSLHNDDENQV